MASLGTGRYGLRIRQKSRRIESKTGSGRSHDEESYSHKEEELSQLRFIPLVIKRVPDSTPESSSLTRQYFHIPFKMEECCDGKTLDQLFARVGPYTMLMWNNHWYSREAFAQAFFDVPVDKYGHSRWSPLGSYFVTSHDHTVFIWGSKDYLNCFGDLMCFNHHKVEQFDVSPGEKYLVTYNRPKPSDPKGLWLKIFDVTSGKGIVGVNGGVADSPQWPVIRWAGGKDDKYFATLNKTNTVSVYETETFSPLGEKPLDLDDVVDISWSPTEPLLAVLLKGRGKQPAKALLLRIPDNVMLAEKCLPAGDCKMHWQSNGEYLAVNTRSGFVFLCIKEEGIPTGFLKVEKKILVAFAWEPSGHRFAVIHKGDEEPNLSSVSFYSMVTPPGKVTAIYFAQQASQCPLLVAQRQAHSSRWIESLLRWQA
ncbi:hypothetical protein N665_0764s0007 [Sinapis alba]|nr:hypothetical protein N665_0764s0007 [Sinapis alba]